jgi:NADP-dependent 3-hydroxy acid dehydrogenase YdfG
VICAVTGGAGGIGRAIADALIDRGATVHVCDITSGVDVTERSAVESWLKDIGDVDVLVNNAAFVRWQPVLDMSVEDAELIMATAYNAMVYTSKAVLPRMIERRSGHIVNIGSSAGRIFVGGASAAYAASKAAVEAYTEMVRCELTGTGVAVTLVRPAAVAGTDFFGKHVDPRTMPRMADFVPYATPAQVARRVVHAIERRKPTVDVPGYLPAMYLGYTIFPRVMQRLSRMGGPGRRTYR